MRRLTSFVRLSVVGIGLFVSTFGIANQASAASILFEHPYPGVDQTAAWCTSCFGSFREFDEFVLAADSDITEIDARLYLPYHGSENIEYSIWDVTRTTQLFAQSFTAAQLSFVSLSSLSYDVSAAISGLSLPAGTYALSLFDATSYVGWFQSDVTVDGKSFQTMGGDGSGEDEAFRIIGSPTTATPVPEPATLLLLGTGVLATRLRKPKRRP